MNQFQIAVKIWVQKVTVAMPMPDSIVNMGFLLSYKFVQGE